jgi:hypothetical protein
MGIPVQPANIPPPQTTVAQFPNPALAGQRDGARFADTRTRVSDVALSPGYGVCTGAGNGEVTLPAVATDITAHFQGVVVQQELKEPVGAPGGPYSPQYRANEPVPILAKGGIWVVCEDTMVDDGAVYCVFAVTDTKTIGTFVASALAGTSAALVPNAKVRIGGVGTHAAPVLCLVEFATVA